MSGVPAVSIIVPNFNHAPFLQRRLDSILGQTLADYELILLDDASTDNSREVISPYLGDPRVRFQPNRTNSGSPFAQWNRGIALARGSLVWIAESDDYADREFLQVLCERLDRNPAAGIAFCQSLAVDAAGAVVGDAAEWMDEIEPGRWRADFVADGREECARRMLWKNTIPNASAALFRRDAYLRAGGAPDDMRLAGDWMAWVRMLMIGDLAFCARRLNFFRQHSAAVRVNTKQARISMERWRIRSLIARKCPLSREIRKELARHTRGEIGWVVRNAPPLQRPAVLLASLGTSWPMWLTM